MGEATIKSRLNAVLVIGCLLCLALSTCARVNAVQSGLTFRRHFIVLIDDSGSIAGRSKHQSQDKRLAIKADLPDHLFGGIKGIPAFDPAHDKVSVLFFTILDSLRDCDKRQPKSTLPKNIFDLLYTGTLLGKADFASKLEKGMSNECRFHGNWSPIVISSLLVLPYLQDKLPPGELHGETILIQVTDAEFNSQAKPGHELTAYRQARLADVPVADEELNRVSNLFSLNILPNQESRRGVFYLAAKYSSQRTPESAVQYQRNSLLYPQALSSDDLRYRLNDHLLGDIQLLSHGTGAEFEFRPLWLRVGFQNERGEDWSIGSQTLPRLSEETKPVSLHPCNPPLCEASSGNDRLGIDLFESGLGVPLKVSRSDDDPEPGQIRFSVGFHYYTKIYDHLCVETPELLVKAAPAPPAEIPNLLLPASSLSKADVAAEWEQDEDGVTTREEAKNRVLASNNLRWVLRFILLVILVVLVVVLLFLKYFQRRFSPQLKWLATPEVVVDFNRPAASRLLVGTLKVENNQPMPWLGRLLKRDEQPTRQAQVSLQYNYFEQSRLDLARGNPIGFMRGEKTDATEREELQRLTQEAVSDGRQVYIFLAAEKINDYRANQKVSAVDANGPDAHFAIPLKAQMEWSERKATQSSLVNWLPPWLKPSAISKRRSVEEHFQCSLIVKPEEPRKPRVRYVPVDDPFIYFEKNARVQIGSFWFESQALHRFAQPYRWDGYTIQTFQGNRPLSGEPIRLADSAVEVHPNENVEVPVYIYCDGETISNPDPISCDYSFKLIGDFSADSEPGYYHTTLHRDPTLAEIELEIIQPKRRLEVYWTPQRTMQLRTMPDGADANEFIKDADTIVLEPKPIRFDASNTYWRELLSFKIGNSGSVGRGVVDVEFITHIRCDDAVRNSIQLHSGQELEDLLRIYDVKVPQSKVQVEEGAPARSRQVYLLPEIISRIVSARIEADRIAAEIKVNIRVVDDEGNVTRRTFTVVIPLRLEQLPGLNWLAIDFGTSAISAAIGAGRGESVMMIPLQDITVEGGRSFAQHDISNSERENRHLLPSWICCNADLRHKSGDRGRPGFPGYYSENLSMTPGEPDFIGLPAVTHEFEEYPGRIIYSLKSWLGKASRNIPIEIKENGQPVQRLLPLDQMVESSFAALAEGYLFYDDYRADQIVIAHPNTFTKRHRDLLHRIAHKALGKRNRFGIPLPERVRLISESDAVAYHYCTEQMRGQPRAGLERLMVYDFGAGTLDLSVIEVTWKQDSPRFPVGWRVVKRLGVPVAGNYVDEVLARLIHDLLSDPSIVDSRTVNYQFSIVGRRLESGALLVKRRVATINLWNWIREAKHEWSRKCREVIAAGGTLDDAPPLKVRVGDVGSSQGVVSGLEREGVIGLTEPVDGPGLWVGDKGSIFLSIPARLINQNERMSEFIDFVTEEVVDEVLESAGVGAADINTVIVSGRGALFPELREKVWRRFPNADTPDLLTNDTMKSAVVLGAIARQSLSRVFTDASDAGALEPQLGVLINDGYDLVWEKDWNEIDLTASPTFRLVQINCNSPNPREDMKSLRKHFYIDLTDQKFVRDDILGDDKHLCVHKETLDGELAIYLQDREGAHRTPVFAEGQISKTVTNPPWPIGNLLLDPQE